MLVANRGEIAVRIARTARAMGMRTVAVYSDADADSEHVRACDVAVRIGAAPARDSYLRADRLIEAARTSEAQAIHPGYGFLSENADFAEGCAQAGLVFVGPPPAAMRSLGDKIVAKRTAAAAGVPIIEGSKAGEVTPASLAAEARRLGVPLVIKAAAGGGGKGMRVVTELDKFDAALESAQREAAAAFGDGAVFLERYLEAPRHIEVQILADAFGTCVHLGERECSVQRRHQKLLEEAPSTAVGAALRSAMGEAAVRLALAAGYVNAGTVEFMLDDQGRYYFLEMNARLQVEHAVTEAVTGTDLVREQFEIAGRRPLRLSQRSILPRGHAIEVRVYAEDAANDFLPSAGTVEAFHSPQGPGIRNDTALRPGSEVTLDYDPMLAKLIAFDRTREDCIERLGAALDDYTIAGVTTNLPFLRWLVTNEHFRAGETTTAFLSEHFHKDTLATDPDVRYAMLAAAGAIQFPRASPAAGSSRGTGPWKQLGPWRAGSERRKVRFESPPGSVADVEREIETAAWRCRLGDLTGSVSRRQEGSYTLHVGQQRRRFTATVTSSAVRIAMDGFAGEIRLAALPSIKASAVPAMRVAAAGAAASIAAPMSGRIVKMNATAGKRVDAQAVVVVMEAMKMEHSLTAPFAGSVAAVHAQAGDTVAAGDVLLEITPAG
ncbi:MAG: biotin/lipoyl-binding protein [Candidatus Eremiobacteraeota bacterium]|nr:biotin/lipoyl-binding protein [Candidatus Eremiobacteraeota bacterium]MBC5827350.1 biotin/lipoyl-binding protein [Candidatus Eremiobacteraeota bacterium]